jgi:hypothetical protein
MKLSPNHTIKELKLENKGLEDSKTITQKSTE